MMVVTRAKAKEIHVSDARSFRRKSVFERRHKARERKEDGERGC